MNESFLLTSRCLAPWHLSMGGSEQQVRITGSDGIVGVGHGYVLGHGYLRAPPTAAGPQAGMGLPNWLRRNRRKNKFSKRVF